MHKTNAALKDAGYSMEEESKLYDEQLEDIRQNTRRYLDGLTFMATYKLRWKDYRSTSPTIPYRFVKKTNKKE